VHVRKFNKAMEGLETGIFYFFGPGESMPSPWIERLWRGVGVCVRGERFRGSLSGAQVGLVSLVRRTTQPRQTEETR
jgi:hypothetical protein